MVDDNSSKLIKCPHCGSAFMYPEQVYRFVDNTTLWKKICPYCGGTGRTDTTSPICTMCNGTGLVPRDIPPITRY